MPLETRWFVKTSLLWLVAAFALGAIMLIVQAFGRSIPASIIVAHTHMAFVGWLVNFIIGIALWMLPANRERFPKNRGRYPSGAVWVTFWFLNVGLAIRVIVEPLAAPHTPMAATEVLLTASAFAQLAAIVAFVSVAWFRVRSV
ncbi:MAG: hypothetical protein ACYDA5_07435 [Vulcanimicrobiaceae bacterium]